MSNEIMDLVTIEDNQAVTTSLIVAEKFEREHNDVVRTIRKLLSKDVRKISEMFNESTYMDKHGREQPSFLMNRDGFSLLVMGFTGDKALQFKLKFIEAFNNMENQLKYGTDKVPQTFLEALKLAVQKEEERLALEQKYIEAEERAKENQQVKHLYDTTVAKGKWYSAKNVADVMNIIGIGRTKLYDFLREIGLVTSKNEPIHKYIEMGLIRVDYYAEWLEQFVCVFSVKGIRYIFTKLVNAGKMPRDVTMEEWVKLCEDMKE